MQLFITCLTNVLSPKALLYITGGVLWGIIGGAIPGISASIAMSLMLPLIYGMDPMLSLPMLAAVYVGACYGGSIPAILIQTPGTGSSAAAMLDGYALQQRGEGGKALFTSLFSGVVGGLVSTIILLFTAVPLASFAVKFGPAEYFWLSILGLSMVGTVASDSPTKGLLSGLFGLWLSTIGLDQFSGIKRYTFGFPQLVEGLDMIPVFVGIFAIGEIFHQIFTNKIFDAKASKFKMSWPNGREMKSISIIAVISGIWGTLVGALPGAGANIASWSAYAQAKNLCKNSESFGKGDLRGIAAPESANNACPAGALIPLLGLGIPGSNSTAILMCGFTIAGIACGPLLFVNQPEIPYTMITACLISQFCLAAIGLIVIRPLAALASCRKAFLTPAIVMFAVLGAFATTNQVYTCWIVIVFGLIGLVVKWFKFIPSAIALGFVLGELVELNLRRVIQLNTRGGIGAFFTGTINKVLVAALIFSILLPAIGNMRKKMQEKSKPSESEA